MHDGFAFIKIMCPLKLPAFLLRMRN